MQWIDRWAEAHMEVVQPIGPHEDVWFDAYLAWYQPRTRCRITFPEIEPQPHVATPLDTYAYHRDEALAGAVIIFLPEPKNNIYSFL